jgi:hypothetical protein
LFFVLADEVRNYLQPHDGWRTDQQRSDNCLATKVTRCITMELCLWRYVKNLVHQVKNHDLQQLKARIRDAVVTVTHNMLQYTRTEVDIV